MILEQGPNLEPCVGIGLAEGRPDLNLRLSKDDSPVGRGLQSGRMRNKDVCYQGGISDG